MKLVVDTKVLLSGLLWGGPPARILDRIDAGSDKLFISRPLLEELAEVLDRPKFLRTFRRFGHDPEAVLAAVIEWAVVVEAKPFRGVVVEADPADDRVLACAATAAVDFIVTGDAHLLRLQEFRGVKIVQPAAYLALANG